MSTREAFAAALTAEPNFDEWTIRQVTDDLTPIVGDISDDREVIAHALWAAGVYVDHLGECRVDEEYSIYTNECGPCQEYMLAVADRVLGRITLDHVSTDSSLTPADTTGEQQ